MFGYVYLTTNIINGKQYIGRKTSRYFDKNYLGSGTHLHNAIKKYGKENFQVILLEEVDTYEDLVELERYFIALANADQDDHYYNISTGGFQEGFLPGDDNIAKKPENRKKNSEKHKGKKMSESFKQHQSELHKGKPSGMKGHSQTAYCKEINSIKTREFNLTRLDYSKISETAKGNRMMNKNGICIRVHPEHFQEYLDDGWEFGGLPRKGKYKNRHQSKSANCTTKGTKGINNGIINKFIPINQLQSYLDDGWNIGLIRKTNS